MGYECWVPRYGCGCLPQRCSACSCHSMSTRVGHGGRVIAGICSRGQRVSPVIAIQWYSSDSWVATRFARGDPVSRPKTTLGEIHSYKSIVRMEAKEREFPHINDSCELPASRVLSAQFGSAVSTVRCMALLRTAIATSQVRRQWVTSDGQHFTSQAVQRFIRNSKATAAWELQTMPSGMLGNNRISVEAKRGLGSANFLYRSQCRTRRRWLMALVISCMATLVHLAAAASVRHDVDHPELVPVADVSQIVRHTAASCLNKYIHQ